MSFDTALTIYYDKKNTHTIYKSFPFFIILIVYGYLSLPSRAHIFPSFILVACQYLFIASIIILTGALIFSMFLASKPEPLLVMSAEGIQAQHFGFVPWDEIDQVKVVSMPTTPLQYVGIWFKRPQEIKKQATLSGKMAIFWSIKLGNPAITLANTTVSYDEIMSYAQHCMK